MRRLYPTNTFVSPQVGTGRRLVIAEAPGEAEAELGKPLIGGAGKWFDAMYAKAGIKRDELTILNTIQCRPPDNVFPTDVDAKSYITLSEGERSVSQCVREHVRPAIKAKAWDRIDLLGEKALRYIAGKGEGIYKWRGSPLEIEGNKACATLHPAAIARDQTMLPVVINDLRKSLIEPPEYYVTHPSLPEVQAFTADEVCLDIETSYWQTGSPKITMVGVSDKVYHALVIPFTGMYIPEIRRIILNAKVLIGQNLIGFDIPLLFKELDICWKG